MSVHDFILSSDIASLKNDSVDVISGIIANGTIFNPNTSPTVLNIPKSVGTINAGIRAIGNTSKYSGWYLGVTFVTEMLVEPTSGGGGIFLQTLYCNLERISPGTIRLHASFEGVGGTPPDFITREAVTITFRFATFLSPFDN